MQGNLHHSRSANLNVKLIRKNTFIEISSTVASPSTEYRGLAKLKDTINLYKAS